MPFCPEGFSPEPPLSRVVIAPDMTEPLIERQPKAPETYAAIRECLACGITSASAVARIVGRDQSTVWNLIKRIQGEM